jgi:hypothetical protein
MEEIPLNIQMRLQKLLALSQRGVGGEATAARSALERLCDKYGISITELFNEEKRKDYHFEIGRGKQYLQLFVRCFCAVIPATDDYRYIRPSSSSIIIKNLTTAQYIDIKQLYDWHKDNYKRELEKVTSAFNDAYIVKHHLYVDNKECDNDYQPTYEERVKLARARSIMNWMDDATFHKQLECK